MNRPPTPGFEPECPLCGHPLAGAYGQVPAEAVGGTVRVDLDCPACHAELALVGEESLNQQIGLSSQSVG